MHMYCVRLTVRCQLRGVTSFFLNSDNKLPAKAENLGTRVQRLRGARKFTLRDAEKLTGVSRSMISKLERGLASPTTTVLGKLAEGFGVSISQLLGGPAPREKRRTVVLKERKQAVFRVPDSGFERRSLSPVSKGRGIDFVVNMLPPSRTSGTFPAHAAGVEETLAVSSGRLWLFLGGRKIVLKAGDSCFYRADVGHRFENPSSTQATVFYIVIDSTKAV